MKIGIFDSGLGGLIIARAIRKAMPEYDYVYLGDTKRVPYGNRSHEAVYEYTKECVDYLFNKENCGIVIIACNTASARALRKLQKEDNRKILGVLIPAAEEAAKFERVGVIGTLGTVSSGTFPKEINKIWKNKPAKARARIFQNAAPILVPLAEEGETKNALPFIKKYLQPFADKKINALVLGCTHYPIFKKEIKKLLPKSVRIISQDEIIPKKLKEYFARHPEISKKLSQNKTAKILVTDITQSVNILTKKWFGVKTQIKLVNI
jgi:glutamate racemase